jgi:hypothetical protein
MELARIRAHVTRLERVAADLELGPHLVVQPAARPRALEELQRLVCLRHRCLDAWSFLIATAGVPFQMEIRCLERPAFRPDPHSGSDSVAARLLQVNFVGLDGTAAGRGNF